MEPNYAFYHLRLNINLLQPKCKTPLFNLLSHEREMHFIKYGYFFVLK